MDAVQALAREKGVPPVTEEELATVDMRALFRRMRIRWYEIPRYVGRARQALKDNRHMIALQPNIVPVLRWAMQQDVPMAILSSNSEEVIRGMVEQHVP